MSIDWQVRHPTANDVVDPDLMDVYVRDAYNRFARKADLLFHDEGGTKQAIYRKGYPIELWVDIGDGTYRRRWGGFVVNPQSSDNEATIECYSHDLWLRKRDVFASYSNMTISAILKDLIEDLTPLTWDPNLVQLENDATVSREWRGQQLDEVINELTIMSRNENFGATNDRRFYVLPKDTETASRSFTEGEYTRASFGDDGKKEINKVTIYYGEGENSAGIRVDDRGSQERLGDRIGVVGNVVFELTKSYPSITTEEQARQKGREILEGRTSVRTGTLETWAGLTLRPGQVTRVQVPEQEVDLDMRIAQIEYEWKQDKTTLTLAENDVGVIDALVTLSEEVQRLDSRAADPNATLTQFLQFDVPLTLDVQKLVAYSRPVPDSMFHTGEYKGNLGDPDIGGGYLGDTTGDRTKLFEV